MGRVAFDSTDVLSSISEISKNLKEISTKVDGMDSLFCAKSVSPWHGHGVDIPENMSLEEIGKLAFMRAEDVQYSPTYAINPDVNNCFDNLDWNSLSNSFYSGDRMEFITKFFKDLESSGVLLRAPLPGEQKARNDNLVSGLCPETRAIVLRGNPNSIVPNLQQTQIMGFVGNQHTTVTPDEMINFVNALSKAYGAGKVVPLTAGTIDKGGIMFVSAKLDGFGFKPPTVADKNLGILSVVQGMAGNLALTKSLGHTTIVCRNTCTHAVREKGAVKFKHTKTIHQRMANKIDQIANEFLENASEINSEFSAWAERAVNEKVTYNQVEDFIGSYLFGADRWNARHNNQIDMGMQNRLDAYMTAHNVSPGQNYRGVDGAGNGTVWSLYNALTFMDSNVNPTTVKNPYKLSFESAPLDAVQRVWQLA